MKLKFLSLFLLTIVAAIYLASGVLRPVYIDVSISRRSIHVGDPIRYSLVVRADRFLELELPDIEKALEGFSVMDKKMSDITAFGRRIIENRFIITRYEVGECTLPPLAVKYKTGSGQEKTISTGEIKMKVVSLLPSGLDWEPSKVKVGGGLAGEAASGSQDEAGVTYIDAPIRFPIKELAGLRDMFDPGEFAVKTGTAAGVILVVVLTAVFIVLWKRRRKKPLSLDELAMKRLDLIREKGFREKGAYKELAAKLSFTVVDYLKKRYKLPEKAMLTDELLAEIWKIQPLTEEEKKYLEAMIRMSDLVKYSPETPPGADEALDVEKAAGFVRKSSEDSKDKG